MAMSGDVSSPPAACSIDAISVWPVCGGGGERHTRYGAGARGVGLTPLSWRIPMPLPTPANDAAAAWRRHAYACTPVCTYVDVIAAQQCQAYAWLVHIDGAWPAPGHVEKLSVAVHAIVAHAPQPPPSRRLRAQRTPSQRSIGTSPLPEGTPTHPPTRRASCSAVQPYASSTLTLAPRDSSSLTTPLSPACKAHTGFVGLGGSGR